MIPEDTLQAILARVDLVALVADDVANLRRVGQSFRGRCPLCEGLTTLVVFPENRPARWFCFHPDCRQGGNAIAWVQRTRRLHFRDAVVAVCRRFRLPVPAGAEGRRGFRPLTTELSSDPELISADRCSQCGSTETRPCGSGVICSQCWPLEGE